MSTRRSFPFKKKRVVRRRVPRGLPFHTPRAAMKAELKSVDTVQATTQITSAGTFTLLNALNSGSQYYQRVGAKIAMKSLAINLAVGASANATLATDDYARIIIFYDRQANGAVPTVANVLQDRNGAGTSTFDVFCHYNVENSTRFLILFDKVFAGSVSTVATSVAGAATIASIVGQDLNAMGIMSKKIFINLKNLVTLYNAAGVGAIADIQEGSLYYLQLAQNASTGAVFDASFRARVRYYD